MRFSEDCIIFNSKIKINFAGETATPILIKFVTEITKTKPSLHQHYLHFTTALIIEVHNSSVTFYYSANYKLRLQKWFIKQKRIIQSHS